MKRCVPVLIAVVLVFMSTTAFGQHFEFVQTDVNASNLILSATINDESLVEGDEIGVFTPGGVCAGAGTVPAGFPDNALGVAAWGAEQGQQNGFAAGNVIEYRLWSVDLNAEITVAADDRRFVAGDGVWVGNGMNVVMLSAQHEVIPVPVIEVNPANINFGVVLTGEESIETLTITNTGEEVLNVGDFDVANIDGEAFSFNIDIPDFPWEFVQTDNNMSNLITSALLNGESLVAGDYVGVFTTNDLCAGFGVVPGANEGIGFPAWGTEQGQNNGFNVGEEMQYRFWDTEQGREYNAEIGQVFAGENNYTINGMFVAVLTAGDGFMPAIGGFELAPDESFEIEVLFAPDGVGEFTGEIVIPSDDPDNEEVVVALLGNAILPDPEISLNVEGHDFGGVLVGESANWTFTISNVGGGDLTVESAAVTGDFFSGDGEDGFVIAVGETQDVTVTFAPEAGGDFAGEVTITSDDPNNGSVALNLAGVGEEEPVPEISVDVNAHDFGSILIGESENWTFSIANIGNAELTVESAAVTGDFFSGDGEDGFVIAVNESQDVTVAFAPEEAGEFGGEVTITSDDPNQRVVILDLTGVGEVEAMPDIAADPEAIDFGEVFLALGDDQPNMEEEIITISNAGDAPLTVFDAVLEGDGFFLEIDLGNDGGGEEFNWEFSQTDANMSILVRGATINGEDLQPGDYIGSFTEAGLCAGYSEVQDAGAQLGVPAWGAEQGQQNGFRNGEAIEMRFFDSDPGREYVAEYAEVQQGEPNFVANGFLACVLSVGDGFVPAEVTLNPGEEVQGTVFFGPVAEGEHNGTITFSSDDPDGDLVVNLTGVGVLPAAEIMVDAEGHDFGAVMVGESADWAFNISNVGGDDLTVQAIDVVGDFFSADAGDGFVLASGEMREVMVTFAPEDGGEFDGSVTIMSNDEDEAEIVLGLAGVGEVNEFPVIAVDAEVIDFGDVIVGEGADDLLVISNEGNAPLTIIDVTVEGVGFTIDVNLDGGGGDVEEFPWEFGQTDINMSTLIQEIDFNGEVLGEGNYVGVFTENGTCAGFGEVFDAGEQMGVPAWGAEQGQQNGFVANEAIEFRIWETDPGREYVADIEALNVAPNWVGNGFLVCNLSVGGENMPAELVLEPGATLEVPVFFNPEEEMDYEGAITITSDDPDNDMVVVGLMGVGVLLTPEIVVNEEGYDFGVVEVGQMADWSFNIANVGEADLNVESVVIDGMYFSVDVEEGFVLASGEDRNVGVMFEPEDAGEFDAVVTITSNDPENGEIVLNLTGVGEVVEVPSIAVDAEVIDFGDVLVGEAAEDLLVISNEGGAPLTIIDVMVEGDGFTIDVDLGGDVEEFNWEYAQTDINMSTLIQEIDFNGEILGEGNYVGVFTENGTCAGFGEVSEAGEQMGVPAWGAEQGRQNGFVANEPIEFRIWETDSGREFVAEIEALNVAPNWVGNGFLVCNLSVGGDNMPAELVLDPGATLEVPVFFNPEAEMDYEGAITIVSDDPDDDVVMVQLLGVGMVDDVEQWIGFDPEMVEFAPVIIGEQGEEILTVFNMSEEEDLMISDLVIDNDVFSIEDGLLQGEFDWAFVQTDNNMSIIVQDAGVNGDQLEAGDYIGVFTEDGLCAGYTEVPEGLFGDGGVGVSAWGSEQDANNGFDPQEDIEFRIWDTDAGRQFVADPEIAMGEAIFVSNGFLVLSGLNGGGGMNPADLAIEPGGSLEITVFFDPEEDIEYNGSLTVMSNDPVVPEAVVDLMGNGSLPAANIDVSAEAYDFEGVHVGDPADWTFTVSNIGGGSLTVESVVTDGDGFMDNMDEGFVLESGASQEIMVTFSPDAPEEYVGSVTITSNDEDEGEVVIELDGFGFLNAPVITLSAEAYDFGELFVNDTDEWSFEIGNDGETDLNVEDITVEGMYFSIDEEGGFSLEPGEVAEVVVTFAPEDAGEFEGMITIASDDPNGDAMVAVVGSAVWYPMIALDPDDVIDFGELYMNDLGEAMVNISNPGGSPLTVSDIVVEGDYFFMEEGDEPGDFDWEYVQTDVNMSIIVQDASIGGEQIVAGDVIGVFTEEGMCAGYAEVPEGLFGGGGVGLSAWGTEQGANNGFAVGEDIEFQIWDMEAGMEFVAVPEIAMGEAVYTGNGFLVLAGLNAERQMIPAFEETVIAPGESIDVPVFFMPENAGEFDGMLTVLSDARDMEEVSVDLFGIGLSMVMMSIPESHDFGELLVGESAEWVFSIENIGDADLNIEAVALEGAEFSMEGDDDGGVLEAGEFFLLRVTFEPDQAGDFEALVIIESNAPENDGIATISLTGSAVWFPIIRLEPADEIDFGAVPIEEEVVEMLRIYNDGLAPLVVDELQIDGEGFSLGAFQGEEPGEFEWEFGQTDVNASILVTEATIGNQSLVEGDVIGVFTEEGLCAGYAMVPADFPNESVGIPAWGAEQGQNNGFQVGEAVGYRFWDDDAGREFGANANYMQGNGNWVGNAFFVVRLSADDGFVPMEAAEIIEPESFLDVEVFFRPEASGEYEGNITVNSNDLENGELNVHLMGNGFVSAIITVSEEGHDFGELLVGENADWQFTVGNAGEADLEVESIRILGDYYSLVPDEAFVLASGEELEFTVTFAPEDAGDELNGNVVIVSNDPVNGELVMNLTGSALWFPIIALDPDDVVDFGEMFDGGEVEEVIVITNEGRAPLTIENIRVAGNGFALGEMDMGDPIVLEPDESFEASVFFQPDNEGEFNGTFTVISDDPSLVHSRGRVIVRLSGIGYFTPADIDVSVEGLDFEGVVVGESSTLAFTIANLGQLPLAVEGVVLEGEYYSSDAERGFEIGRDGEMAVEITFAPEMRGDFDGMITILSNDEDSPEVMVSLAGMGLAPVIDVDPLAIDFGRVFIDEEDNREIVITNEGDADLIIAELILDNEAYSFDPPEQGEFDWVFQQSDASMNVLVLDGHLDGRELAAGDVIGVFTDEGICGGFGLVPDDVFEAGVGIAVWADEVGGEVTGFVANQTLNYRIWDESAAREYAADADYIQGNDFFVANGFSVINVTAGNGFFEPADLAIAPGESESIMLYFRPLDGIDYEATLTVVNNDPEAPEVVVDIMGEGRFHNQPPVWVDVPAEIQTDEDTDFNMLFSAEDPDDDPMTITFVDVGGNLPDEAMFEDNEDGTGLFSWRTNFEDEGEYEFSLTVADNFNNEAVVEVSLTVNNVNRAPIWLDPIETVEAFEDEEFEIFMESVDLDGEDLTVTVDFEFEADFVDHEDGAFTFTWRPDYDKAGEHLVTFTSSDGDLSTDAEVVITIIDVNRAPELDSPIGMFEMDEDGGRSDIVNLDDVFFDADGDELMFDILNIDNLGYLGLEIDDNNVLSVDPEGNYFGETDITIIADDGVDQFALAPMGLNNGAAAFSASRVLSRSVRSINNTPAVGPDRDETVSDRFTLVVNSVNDMPIVEADLEDVTVDEDSGLITIDISGVFSDVEDDDLDYSVMGAPGEMNANIADGELTFDLDENFNHAGGAEITVTAEDDDGAMAEVSFMVTVNPVNDAPVVSSPIDDQVFNEDPGRLILADLDDVFFDVDGDDLEYTFETEGGDRLNMGMDGNYNLFLNPDEDFVTPDAPVLVTLTATDPDGETVVFEFTIAIQPVNDAPIVANAINNVTIDEDSQAIIMTDLDNNFEDPDGQILTYEISGAPDEVNMIVNDDNVLIFHPDADFNLPDGVDVTITASDPFGESVDDVFRLAIRAVNDAPTWVEFPEDIIEGLEGDVVEFSLIASDIDSEDLMIDWVDADGIAVESLTDNNDGTASISWTPTFEDEGEFNPIFSVSDGQFDAEVTVSITITDVPQLQHFVDFIQTGTNHSILIDQVALDGNDVPSLWEVGVFNAEGVLAGAFLWDADEGQVGGPVWGDDPDTDDPDGMRDNEEMLFKIWDFETDTEFDAVAEIIDGSVNWTADGFTILNLNSFEIRDLNISFTSNWNIMSMNIVPEEQYWSDHRIHGHTIDVVLMLEQLAGDGENHNVLLIKNDSGRFYHPRSGFKNLDYWDTGEGYAIRMEAAIEGTWSGSPIPVNTPVTVRNGWNYVPYYPNYELTAVRPDFYVLSDIIGNVRLAKNGAGRFMAPQVGFSNMPPWEEGQGYQVKMQNLDGATDFTYPAEPEEEVAMVGFGTEMGRHYIDPVSTGDNMSVLISSISDFVFSADDQIAAYSADGKVVGTSMVDEEGRCGIAVWGTDQTSEEVNGLQQGEAFELKLWDADRGVEVSLMPTAILEGKLEYETDGFVMLDLGVKPDVPGTYFLSRAYPNPFNSTTRLTYGMTEAGHASVSVFDMSGRLVANLVDGTVAAGYHNVVWGGADLATGVYMIQFEAAGFKSVSKVVLMK